MIYLFVSICALYAQLLCAGDSAQPKAHTHAISYKKNESHEITHVIKEYRDPRSSALKCIIRDVTGTTIAQQVGIVCPDTQVMPLSEELFGKSAGKFGIESVYIDHHVHDISLATFTNAQQLLSILVEHPSLVDILAFDIATKNCDRRPENLLCRELPDKSLSWYAIDHEWAFGPYRAASIYCLNRYLLDLAKKNKLIGNFLDCLKAEYVCDEQMPWAHLKPLVQDEQSCKLLAKKILPRLIFMNGHIHPQLVKTVASDVLRSLNISSQTAVEDIVSYATHAHDMAYHIARLYHES